MQPVKAVKNFLAKAGVNLATTDAEGNRQNVDSFNDGANKWKSGYKDGECGIAAVKGCKDLISNNLFLAKKIVVRLNESGFEERLYDHEVTLLWKNPSKRMNRVQFESLAVNNLLNEGNFYGKIRRVGIYPVEIIPATCGGVWRDKKKGLIYNLQYLTNYGGYVDNVVSENVPARDVLHVSALNPHDLWAESYPPMYYAYKSATIYGMSLDRISELLKQGGGNKYLETQLGFDAKKMENWVNEYENKFKGKQIVMELMPIVPGGTINAVPFANVDPGIVELLRFEVAEISRIFGVPQGLIGHHEKGSSERNANIVTADFTLLKKKSSASLRRSVYCRS